MLAQNTLDEITQKKREFKNEEQNPQDTQKEQEFHFLMNFNYQCIYNRYPEELNLLYVLCQSPSGLSETDIH